MTEQYDLIIIGGGPAGLAAGIYGGRAKLKTLLLEKGAVGGRAETTREIVNYPGFMRTTGPELTQAMKEQALHFGVELRTEKVSGVELSGEYKVVKTRKHHYQAPAVILAMGTEARILGIPGERELTGQGVAYCATCDAEFFQDQHVVVVGSGDQGIEESMYIAKFASQVTIVVLHEEGVLDCNKQAAAKAFAHPKLNFLWNSVVDQVNGDDEVTSVTVRNIKTGVRSDLPCGGIFFFVGLIPSTQLLDGTGVTCTQQGYVVTNERMETALEGVYAAGDIRDKYLRQVATAVGDGAIAATNAERYIEEQKDFQRQVAENDRPVLLAFWSSELQEGLTHINRVAAENEAAGSPCAYLELDAARKLMLAQRYQVALTPECPAAVLLLNKGQLVKRLDLSKPLISQLNEMGGN